jgi:hypothetical protein
LLLPPPLLLTSLLQDAVEIMRESLFDLCPAGGGLGLGVLDFRAQPGTRKGKVRAVTDAGG